MPGFVLFGFLHKYIESSYCVDLSNLSNVTRQRPAAERYVLRDLILSIFMCYKATQPLETNTDYA